MTNINMIKIKNKPDLARLQTLHLNNEIKTKDIKFS
jgi:hypothetical protein